MKHLYLLRRYWLRVVVLLIGIGVLTCYTGLSLARNPVRSSLATVTLPVIPISADEIVNPLRGFYQWYGQEVIPQPRPSYDQYARFNWRELEPTKGVYDFSSIEQGLITAQQHGAKYAFRVMAVNEFNGPVEVPDYLVQAAGGSFCTYGGANVWVPSWDNPAFLERAKALSQALSSYFDGDPRLAYYDMGIYGHWGEWHTLSLCTPPASDATKRALVDMQVEAFANTRILMNSGGDEVDAFLYALNKSPRIGVRVDSLCDSAFDYQFNLSPTKAAAMRERWKNAPIVAEFYSPNPSDIALCQQQVQTWHIAAIANARLDWGSYLPDQQQQLTLLGKQAGYRFVINSLTYPEAISSNVAFTITSQWTNQGVTPAYEPFGVIFTLQRKGQDAELWQQASQLDLEQLLPSDQPISIVDQFYIPDWLPSGEYTLSLKVIDPAGYRAPLLLGNAGADASGRYILGDLTVAQSVSDYHTLLPLIATSRKAAN